MTPATVKFNYALIRLFKGVLKAWEDWLRGETNDTTETPDEHFGKFVKK